MDADVKRKRVLRRKHVIFLRSAHFDRRPPNERAPEPDAAAGRAEFDVGNDPLRSAQAEINELHFQGVPTAFLRQFSGIKIVRAIIGRQHRLRLRHPVRLHSDRRASRRTNIRGLNANRDLCRTLFFRNIDFLHQRTVDRQNSGKHAVRPVTRHSLNVIRVVQAHRVSGRRIGQRRRPQPIVRRMKIRGKRIADNRRFCRHFCVCVPERHPFEREQPFCQQCLAVGIGFLRIHRLDMREQVAFRNQGWIEHAVAFETGGDLFYRRIGGGQ